jgi:hypothetical protein
MDQSTPPVLVLAFNRVRESKALYEVLRRVQPSRLYVSIDGPRPDVPEDESRCAQVAEVFSHPDWEVDLRIRARQTNMGCSPAIIDAITWFFDSVDAGCIIEDDCLPSETFFPYASELLNRYQENLEVFNISGNFLLNRWHTRSESYFPSRYGHTLGWASWARAWEHFDHKMADWPNLRESDWLLRVCNQNRAAAAYFTKIFDRSREGPNIEWDQQWLYSIWRAQGISLVPTRNLVVHTGIGELAFHTKTASWLERLPLETIEFPLVHPESLESDPVADLVTENKIFIVTPSLIQKCLYFGRRPAKLIERIYAAIRGLNFHPAGEGARNEGCSEP